ncbi:MAG: rRNA pseudouridine synthase [Ruminococcaceae bacterium]|nr:rRNA pseudouridine synthase [Oscillospiraceae bacterium]
MRLDKILSDSGLYSRKEAGDAVRRGRVTVDGIVCRDPGAKFDENSACVVADGKQIGYVKFRYIMLNKPSDTVSTTEDDPKSVMKLLPLEYQKMDMFPCGRLDIDTLGLLLITNDGQTAHALLSPKHHCEKTYRFECLPIDEDARVRLESGLELSDFVSKPCKVELSDPTHGEITVTEGKYHQVKRMFHAVGSEITYLERIRFAGLELDASLERGQWRELTEGEMKMILEIAK